MYLLQSDQDQRNHYYVYNGDEDELGDDVSDHNSDEDDEDDDEDEKKNDNGENDYFDGY